MIDADVFALVLVHNAGADLDACLTRLLEFFSPDRIILGDNASDDGAPDEWRDRVRVEKFEQNFGYCAGMNRLLEAASRAGARDILSLNPDTLVSEADVRLLLDALRDESVALAHPRILRRNDEKNLDGTFGAITWRHLAVRMNGEGRPDNDASRESRVVPFGHGACFVAKPRILLDIGGFDEQFFAYQEEADLGLRLRKEGYTVMYAPKAAAIHQGPWSDPDKMERKMFYLARNSVLLVRKHAGILQKLKFIMFLFGATVLLYLPRAAFGDRLARAALRGWRDGVRFTRMNRSAKEHA